MQGIKLREIMNLLNKNNIDDSKYYIKIDSNKIYIDISSNENSENKTRFIKDLLYIFNNINISNDSVTILYDTNFCIGGNSIS